MQEDGTAVSGKAVDALSQFPHIQIGDCSGVFLVDLTAARNLSVSTRFSHRQIATSNVRR